ncbi:hypothetical protein E4U56_007250 [Claviceps arundinis]|uniref:Uncharacterized protein n=1 Tax=Claviceps arundinis TaxID=1623583 RepID=A0A9P7SKR6_9HYPO|nr:hypothetical protein E4U56_007250 [Claviceps arundinis]
MTDRSANATHTNGTNGTVRTHGSDGTHSTDGTYGADGTHGADSTHGTDGTNGTNGDRDRQSESPTGVNDAMEAQLSTATSTETETETETEIRRVTPQQARAVLERRRRQRESISAGVANGLGLISLRREVADGASVIALSGSSRAEWDQLDADFPEEDLYRRMWRLTREHVLGDEETTTVSSDSLDSSDSSDSSDSL